METFGLIVHLFLLFLVLVIPIALTMKNMGFIKVNFIALPLSFLLIAFSVYWPELYTNIRLELMGFDFDGMNDTERARNVVPELREEATKLYWSHMGIGWPLKAIAAIFTLSPYPSIAFGLVRLVKYVKHRLLNEYT